MSTRWVGRVSTSLAMISMVACTSSSSWDGRVYRSPEGTFRTGPVPATWKRIEVNGAMLAFEDQGTGGVVNVHVRCGKDADDVPLSALTRHLLIGFTDRSYLEEKTEPFDGREALHSVVDAKLDGVPVTMDLYVLKKDGCVYDLGFAASPSKFAAGRDGFEQFARGFHAR